MIKHPEFLRRHDDGQGGGESETYDPTKLLDMRQLNTKEFGAADLDFILAFTEVYNRIVEYYDISASNNVLDYSKFPPELKTLCMEAAKHYLITTMAEKVAITLYMMYSDTSLTHPRIILNSVLEQFGIGTIDQFDQKRLDFLTKLRDLADDDTEGEDGEKNIIRKYKLAFSKPQSRAVIDKFASLIELHISEFVMTSLVAHLFYQQRSSRAKREIAQQ